LRGTSKGFCKQLRGSFRYQLQRHIHLIIKSPDKNANESFAELSLTYSDLSQEIAERCRAEPSQFRAKKQDYGSIRASLVQLTVQVTSL
jgi:hypothetical protein